MCLKNNDNHLVAWGNWILEYIIIFNKLMYSKNGRTGEL